MSYAKTNLHDVKDSAAEYGLSEFQEARFPREDLGAEQNGLNFLILKPGKREPFAHRHRTAEEIYVVLEGSGRLKLDADIIDLNARDALRVSPGVTRCLEAGADGITVLITSPRTPDDAEVVEDFWSE